MFFRDKSGLMETSGLSRYSDPVNLLKCMNIEIITSVQNPLIKQIRALQKRRERERTGLTVVEGIAELSGALRLALGSRKGAKTQRKKSEFRVDAAIVPWESSLRIEAFLVCPERVSGGDGEVLLMEARAHGIVPRVVAPHIYEKLAYREDSGGILAVIRWPLPGLEELPLSGNPLILIADAIEKPGNLGAMMRSADAAGVDALIASDPVTDLLNPNVIRASVGTVFSLPVTMADSDTLWHWLGDRGIAAIAASPDGERPYTEADYTQPAAVIVGNEHHGVSQFWMERAKEKVFIPMRGKADSLNAGVAAAVMLFEAARQRA